MGTYHATGEPDDAFVAPDHDSIRSGAWLARSAGEAAELRTRYDLWRMLSQGYVGLDGQVKPAIFLPETPAEVQRETLTWMMAARDLYSEWPPTIAIREKVAQLMAALAAGEKLPKTKRYAKPKPTAFEVAHKLPPPNPNRPSAQPAAWRERKRRQRAREKAAREAARGDGPA